METEKAHVEKLLVILDGLTRRFVFEKSGSGWKDGRQLIKRDGEVGHYKVFSR